MDREERRKRYMEILLYRVWKDFFPRLTWIQKIRGFIIIVYIDTITMVFYSYLTRVQLRQLEEKWGVTAGKDDLYTHYFHWNHFFLITAGVFTVLWITAEIIFHFRQRRQTGNVNGADSPSAPEEDGGNFP
ncbi:MAG TPA: hypothetical protein PK014_14910 [Thermoanaerobaculia bacterium]|nr:hypothetical protein [Thermoanaerobaculia bacterium]HXK69671.1 hypothetical protein [Thermoanaerobaculia bacterium]